MPRFYAATFAATRIRMPQLVWAAGYLRPQLSLQLAKVVSTTWRAKHSTSGAGPRRRCGQRGDMAAYAVAQRASHSSPWKPLSLRRGWCDGAPQLGHPAIHVVGGGTGLGGLRLRQPLHPRAPARVRKSRSATQRPCEGRTPDRRMALCCTRAKGVYPVSHPSGLCTRPKPLSTVEKRHARTHVFIRSSRARSWRQPPQLSRSEYTYRSAAEQYRSHLFYKCALFKFF